MNHPQERAREALLYHATIQCHCEWCCWCFVRHNIDCDLRLQIGHICETQSVGLSRLRVGIRGLCSVYSVFQKALMKVGSVALASLLNEKQKQTHTREGPYK